MQEDQFLIISSGALHPSSLYPRIILGALYPHVGLILGGGLYQHNCFKKPTVLSVKAWLE